jgi:5'(3')-deoxyribonucleotidase
MTTLSDNYPTDNHDAIMLWDMDGCLADYDEAMERELSAMRSPDETWEGRAHDIANSPGSEWMRNRIALVRRRPGFWRELKPLRAGFELVTAAKKFNFENHVLTKGPSKAVNAWSEKAEWCAQHVPDFHIHMSQKKSLVYGKVLVDDWPGYFMPWLEVRPRGLVIAPKWPWNETYEHNNLVHYDGTNINEIVDRLAASRAAVKRER